MSTATQAPTIEVTVATFDQAYNLEIPVFRVARSERLSSFRSLDYADYDPRGGTPLRDATMDMIHHLDKRRSEGTIQIGLLLDESGSMSNNRDAVIAGVNEFVGGMRGIPAKEGNRVLCVIFTDGYENSSTKVTPDVLAEAVSAREAAGWTFIFMGANMDAWDEGHRNTGISGGVTGQSVNFASTPVGTQSAFRETSRRSNSYLAGEQVYAAMASAAGNNSTVNEDGSVTSGTPPTASPSIPKPGGPKKPRPKPGYDMSDALKKASESQSS